MLDPKNVTVYVVGIERYAAGERWNLRGPVRDALDFAEWVVSKGVPIENVTAFLAPLSSDDPLAGRPELAKLKVREANTGTLYTALEKELGGRQPRHFCLFWGGHGCQKAEGRRHLIGADATESNVQSIDLTAFIQYLRTESFGPDRNSDLWECIVIADVCASFAFARGLDRRLTSQNFPAAKDVERALCALYATDSGQLARNLSAENTGLFSRELRNELTKHGSIDALAEIDKIGLRLREQFAALAREGGARRIQTPTFYSVQPFRNAEQTLGDASVAEIDRREAQYRARPSEFAELFSIMEQLLAPIPEAQCRRMFTEATPGFKQPPVSRAGEGYFQDCAWTVNHMFPDCLFAFLELTRRHIEGTSVDEKLHSWLRALASRLGFDLDALQKKLNKKRKTAAPGTPPDVLQIVVAPVFGYSRGDERYEIHAGLLRSPREGRRVRQPKPFLATAEMKREELAESLRPIMRKVEEVGDSTEELHVEAVLPKELFASGACHWKVRWGAKDLQIGKRYAVALRSYERCYSGDYAGPRRLQRKKWRRLADGVITDAHIAWHDSLAALAEQEMDAWSGNETLVVCALSFAHQRMDQADNAVEYLISSGIALGVWFHEPALPANGWRELVRERFLPVPVSQWRAAALDFHRYEETRRALACTGLALLWDDPKQPFLKLPDRAGAPLQAPSSGTES
jgi:hypothetical protein